MTCGLAFGGSRWFLCKRIPVTGLAFMRNRSQITGCVGRAETCGEKGITRVRAFVTMASQRWPLPLAITGQGKFRNTCFRI